MCGIPSLPPGVPPIITFNFYLLNKSNPTKVKVGSNRRKNRLMTNSLDEIKMSWYWIKKGGAPGRVLRVLYHKKNTFLVYLIFALSHSQSPPFKPTIKLFRVPLT